MTVGCIFRVMNKTISARKQAVRQRLIHLAEETERQAGDKEWGRYARIHRYFDERGHSIKQQSIRKWFDLSTDSVPSDESATILADYYGSTKAWILEGRGPAGVAKDQDTQENVPLYQLPVLNPGQLRDWLAGSLTEPPIDFVEVIKNFGVEAFAFAINDNSGGSTMPKGMKAVVIRNAEDLLNPVTARRPIVVLDKNQFLFGDYSKTPYPSITPPNPDYRVIELTPEHEVIGVVAGLAMIEFPK